MITTPCNENRENRYQTRIALKVRPQTHQRNRGRYSLSRKLSRLPARQAEVSTVQIDTR